MYEIVAAAQSGGDVADAALCGVHPISHPWVEKPK